MSLHKVKQQFASTNPSSSATLNSTSLKMRTSTQIVRRSTNHFDFQLSSQMASSYGASLSYNAKRKTPERNDPISYYEGDTDSEDEYQGHDPEDTIIVDGPLNKKRKVVILDDDSDEDISPAKLSVVKDDGLKEDGPAGKLFRGLPTEVPAAHFSPFLSSHIPLALRATVCTRSCDNHIVSNKEQDHNHHLTFPNRSTTT
jgi:hypothetical protein